MTQIIYTPGICNIGPEEIKRRKMIGWIGLIITIILVAVVLLLPIPHVWRAIVFLPAFVAASGFIQAYFHFCVGFAQAGVYNVGPIGSTQVVTDEKSKKSDSKRTGQLYTYIVLIALIVTVIVFFI